MFSEKYCKSFPNRPENPTSGFASFAKLRKSEHFGQLWISWGVGQQRTLIGKGTKCGKNLSINSRHWGNRRRRSGGRQFKGRRRRIQTSSYCNINKETSRNKTFFLINLEKVKKKIHMLTKVKYEDLPKKLDLPTLTQMTEEQINSVKVMVRIV